VTLPEPITPLGEDSGEQVATLVPYEVRDTPARKKWRRLVGKRMGHVAH
jgi:hypothetical protein